MGYESCDSQGGISRSGKQQVGTNALEVKKIQTLVTPKGKRSTPQQAHRKRSHHLLLLPPTSHIPRRPANPRDTVSTRLHYMHPCPPAASPARLYGGSRDRVSTDQSNPNTLYTPPPPKSGRRV